MLILCNLTCFISIFLPDQDQEKHLEHVRIPVHLSSFMGGYLIITETMVTEPWFLFHPTSHFIRAARRT